MTRVATTALVCAALTLPSAEAIAALPDAEIEQEVTNVLKDARYTFCHDARPLEDEMRGACAYAKAAGDACPAFVKACASAKPPVSRAPSPLRVPLWITQIARVLFWLLLGAAVVWMIRQIVPQLRRGSPTDKETEHEERTVAPAGEAAPVVPRALLDTDAGRLFAAARSAAAMGDLESAVRFAHAAMVRALEHGGYVHVDRTATSGDYLRALRREPDLREVYGGVARELERVEFGARSPTPEKVGGLLASIEPVIRRAAMAILVVVSLGAFGCAPSGTRGDFSDDSPLGASVLRKLLERRGAIVERRMELGDSDLDGVEMVLVADTGNFDIDDWSALDDFANLGGTVVLSGVPSQPPADWGIFGSDPEVCPGPIHARVLDEGGSPRPARIAGRAHALHLDASFLAVVTCDRGSLVARASKGKGAIAVISDPDFISNASMAAGDPAKVLLSLLGTPRRVAVIDRFSMAEGAKDPYRAVAHSGLAPALLHALAWLVLLAVARGKSFGTPRDSVELPRRAFSDHVRAVGRLYELAGASRYALGIYSAWALEQLTSRLRPGGTQRMLELSSAVSQRTRRPEGKVAAVLANAADARDRPGGPDTPAEDLGALRSLDAFLQEIGGRR
jgi:hypothetical protein